MEESMAAAAASSAPSADSDPVSGEAVVPVSDNTTADNIPTTENTTTVATSTTSVVMTTAATSTPPPTQAQSATNYEKTINWLYILSEQFSVTKALTRTLRPNTDKFNIPFSEVTRQKLRRLFEAGEAERSKWITELMALQTRMMLRLNPGEDNIGDVLQELETLVI
ncbi:uncharacterized protein DFL_005319 [Arthrobotrys flagrans]|uniref:Uncharacterized protein n=1 Tax=Arthrobotrys flagrans TaxID=97331 RepID=A0A437A7G7_ARTFL|nr:hypothetical protein DFL_005319 [Arthrobotrys flagrans]